MGTLLLSGFNHGCLKFNVLLAAGSLLNGVTLYVPGVYNYLLLVLFFALFPCIHEVSHFALLCPSTMMFLP